LVGQQVTVHAVRPVLAGLEDVFIQLLQQSRGGHGEAEGPTTKARP
jgi:hypothetical protein